MTEPEPRYALAQAAATPELERLRMLEAINDPATKRRLDEIGVGEGWRCVEVGAGGGSIAHALAQRVGPTGTVVAADMDPRFLQDLSAPNIEVARHDITQGPVPPADFDLAHCRAVLTHVHEPEEAAGHVLASVRPGGTVFLEEPDYGAMEPCDGDHPDADLFLQYRDGFRSGQNMDGFAGRKVFKALQAAGCREIRSEAITAIVHGGSLRARYRRKTMENVRERAIEGAYTPESFDRLLALFDDPGFRYVDSLWVAVIAERPGPSATAAAAPNAGNPDSLAS